MSAENMSFNIGPVLVGGGAPPEIIAEIGINHNGDLNVAKEMAKSALNAGARIIKHQTHIAEAEMAQEAKSIQPINADKNIFDLIDQCSLSEDEEYKLMKYVESEGGVFISTPFSREAVDRLNNFGVPAFKIGSGENSNPGLIDYVLKEKKPVIMSLGMANIELMNSAVTRLQESGVPHCIFHCVNLYPTPFEDTSLSMITKLKEMFPESLVGYSDHTIGVEALIAASALGAVLLEKHYVDHSGREGPDVVCSATEEQMKYAVQATKNVFRGLPSITDFDNRPDKITADFAHASVVSSVAISSGQEIRSDMVTTKRPGKGGIPASEIDKIVGRKLKSEIGANQLIEWDMVL